MTLEELNRQRFIDDSLVDFSIHNSDNLSPVANMLLLVIRMVNRPDIIPQIQDSIKGNNESTNFLTLTAIKMASLVNAGASPEELKRSFEIGDC